MLPPLDKNQFRYIVDPGMYRDMKYRSYSQHKNGHHRYMESLEAFDEQFNHSSAVDFDNLTDEQRLLVQKIQWDKEYGPNPNNLTTAQMVLAAQILEPEDPDHPTLLLSNDPELRRFINREKQGLAHSGKDAMKALKGKYPSNLDIADQANELESRFIDSELANRKQHHNRIRQRMMEDSHSGPQKQPINGYSSQHPVQRSTSKQMKQYSQKTYNQHQPIRNPNHHQQRRHSQPLMNQRRQNPSQQQSWRMYPGQHWNQRVQYNNVQPQYVVYNQPVAQRQMYYGQQMDQQRYHMYPQMQYQQQYAHQMGPVQFQMQQMINLMHQMMQMQRQIMQLMAQMQQQRWVTGIQQNRQPQYTMPAQKSSPQRKQQQYSNRPQKQKQQKSKAPNNDPDISDVVDVVANGVDFIGGLMDPDLSETVGVQGVIVVPRLFHGSK